MESRPLSSEQLDASKGFAAANFQADTNFTIKVGRYQWKVQTSLMSKASKYFNLMCNGSFQEGHEKVVELFDESPVDFIRVLQFIYANNYDRHPGDSSASEHLPFTRFLDQDKQSQQDLAIETGRDKLEIDKAVLTLARKYDVPVLREYIAVHLVHFLPTTDSTQRYCQGISADPDLYTFMPEFVKVFKLIEEDLHELQQIKQRLVDEIFNFMIGMYDENTKTMPMLFFDPEPAAPMDGNSAAPVNEKLRVVQRQLEKCVSENSSFAVEMLKGFQRINSKGFKTFKWSAYRRKALQRLRHRYQRDGQLVQQ